MAPGYARPWIQITNAKPENVGGGVWLPRRCVTESFFEGHPDSAALGERFHRETLVVSSIAVGGPLPDRKYYPEIPPGVTISDERSGSEVERTSTQSDNPQFDEFGNLVVADTSEIKMDADSTLDSQTNVHLVAGNSSADEGEAGSDKTAAVWGTHLPIEIGSPWIATQGLRLFMAGNVVILLCLAVSVVIRRRRFTEKRS